MDQFEYIYCHQSSIYLFISLNNWIKMQMRINTVNYYTKGYTNKCYWNFKIKQQTNVNTLYTFSETEGDATT